MVALRIFCVIIFLPTTARPVLPGRETVVCSSQNFATSSLTSATKCIMLSPLAPCGKLRARGDSASLASETRPSPKGRRRKKNGSVSCFLFLWERIEVRKKGFQNEKADKNGVCTLFFYLLVLCGSYVDKGSPHVLKRCRD